MIMIMINYWTKNDKRGLRKEKGKGGGREGGVKAEEAKEEGIQHL